MSDTSRHFGLSCGKAYKTDRKRQEETDALKDNIVATAIDEGGNTLYESKT